MNLIQKSNNFVINVNSILTRIGMKKRNTLKQVRAAQHNAQARDLNLMPARAPIYDDFCKTMVSFERSFDYRNETWVHAKMKAYADQNTYGFDAQLIVRADQWLVDVQTSTNREAIYLDNFVKKYVHFHYDQKIYAYCLANYTTRRVLKRYIALAEGEELKEIRLGLSEMYSPEMWGKQTEISIPAPKAWVYFLKTKTAFKPRKMPLLETLRQDLRVYLTQQNFVVDSEEKYKLFIAAIVNAFIPNKMDMYAQDMLSSKHIESGINKYNDCLNGDLCRTMKLPKTRELRTPCSTLL